MKKPKLKNRKRRAAVRSSDMVRRAFSLGYLAGKNDGWNSDEQGPLTEQRAWKFYRRELTPNDQAQAQPPGR